MSRPSEYTDETAQSICEQLALGDSLVKICKDLDIGYTTVRTWLQKHEGFALKYAQAREDQADYLAEAILDVADDLAVPPEHKRIMVDARKWYAGKLRPKKYGDKVQTEHSGSVAIVDETDDVIAARFAAKRNEG